MINMFITDVMYLSFHFFVLVRAASFGYIQCEFIPNAVWWFSNIFPALLRVGSLALNRINHLHLGLVLGACILPCWVDIWRVLWHICVSVHLPICMYIHISISMSMSIHQSIYLSVHLYGCTSLCISPETSVGM